MDRSPRCSQFKSEIVLILYEVYNQIVYELKMFFH
jgi:hypothetical protein